jgi:hypothetical protein
MMPNSTNISLFCFVHIHLIRFFFIIIHCHAAFPQGLASVVFKKDVTDLFFLGAFFSLPASGKVHLIRWIMWHVNLTA